MKYYTMKETREFLESIGMHSGDLYDLLKLGIDHKAVKDESMKNLNNR